MPLRHLESQKVQSLAPIEEVFALKIKKSTLSD